MDKEDVPRNTRLTKSYSKRICFLELELKFSRTYEE
jgi:hypothetical protein